MPISESSWERRCLMFHLGNAGFTEFAGRNLVAQAVRPSDALCTKIFSIRSFFGFHKIGFGRQQLAHLKGPERWRLDHFEQLSKVKCGQVSMRRICSDNRDRLLGATKRWPNG